MQISNQQLAYQATRIAIGISMVFHGGVRLPKLPVFVQSQLDIFQHTFIAGTPTLIAAYIIPFLEVSTGLLILIGGKTIRYGLTLGICTMGLLMFGATVAEKFDLLVSMILHIIVFYILLTNTQTFDPTTHVIVKQ